MRGQTCYGVPVVPDGDWLCQLCDYLKTGNRRHMTAADVLCVVCGVAGGPMVVAQATALDGAVVFVHPLCARVEELGKLSSTSLSSDAGSTAAPLVSGGNSGHGLSGCVTVGCSVCLDKAYTSLSCGVAECQAAVHAFCSMAAGLISPKLIANAVYQASDDSTSALIRGKGGHDGAPC